MKQIARQLQEAFLRETGERSVPSNQRADYLKWLRFYLDFCAKYGHAPRDHDSLAPFLISSMIANDFQAINRFRAWDEKSSRLD